MLTNIGAIDGQSNKSTNFAEQGIPNQSDSSRCSVAAFMHARLPETLQSMSDHFIDADPFGAPSAPPNYFYNQLITVFWHPDWRLNGCRPPGRYAWDHRGSQI